MLGLVCILILGVFLGFAGSVLGFSVIFGGFGGRLGFCCCSDCVTFVGAVIVCIVLDGFEKLSEMGFGKLLSFGQVISVWVSTDTFAVLTALE